MERHYPRRQFAVHVDNCQIGVFAAYASRRGRALVDRELYLPKSWTDSPDRCRAARIPEQRVFATKPEIARTMVTRVLAAGMPVGWVAADEAYGADFKFRPMCEQAGVGYVLAVPKSQQVRADGGIWRIDAVFADAPEPAWERMSCGDGAKPEIVTNVLRALIDDALHRSAAAGTTTSKSTSHRTSTSPWPTTRYPTVTNTDPRHSQPRQHSRP